MNNRRNTSIISEHRSRVSFRLCELDDAGLKRILIGVKSIDMLDLDENDITNEGVKLLTELEFIKELRLKGCGAIDDGCIPYLHMIRGLELLHLGGTSVTAQALANGPAFKNLKVLLISSPEGVEEYLERLAILLPAGCELVVNHQKYSL